MIFPLLQKRARRRPGPFHLVSPARRQMRRRLLSLMGKPIETILHFPELNAMYRAIRRDRRDVSFIQKILDLMGVSFSVGDDDLSRIPQEGPLVVVANHPFGGLEGMVIAEVLRQVRPDVKVMANRLLARMPEMHEHMFFVDVFGRKGSQLANLSAIKQAIRWVQDGHVLVIFPAGAVSHLNLRKLAVLDPPWSHTVARIVGKTKAPVTPIYFSGRNGAMFQMAGLVHPTLRTLMLPYETLSKKRTTVALRVGQAIPYRRLSHMSDDQMTTFLRLRTYILGKRPSRSRDAMDTAGQHVAAVDSTKLEPIVPETPAHVVAGEIEALPEQAKLVEQDPYEVYLCAAGQAPHVVREIGRLREFTFRQVNEGTGKPIDLDRFDDYYQHLFVWDRTKQRIVSAYRLGRTDTILPSYGKRGLYTSTLFRFKKPLLDYLNPAIELGRSFVRPEYQKSFSALMLLWKGIATYMVRNPRYRVFFGPVSITAEYQRISQQTIMAFLSAQTSAEHWAQFVKPRNPPKVKRFRGWDAQAARLVLSDIQQVSDLIAEVESDRKGVPILLKQYLKLGARLLTFNVDPDFGNVLDGLMYCDLTKTDPRVLAHYMGKQGARDFLAYHGVSAGPLSSERSSS